MSSRLHWIVGGITFAAALSGASLPAQDLLLPSEGAAWPLYSDVAVLEADEARTDLPCNVTSSKPVLGFDMEFHTGYDVTLPLKEISGDGNLLTSVFRVTAASQPDAPVYFIQRVNVPQIEENARGDVYLRGQFNIGEGKYHVSWLMRDRTERVCSSSWDIEASLPARDRPMPLNIAANAVHPADTQPFMPEPQVRRDPRQAVNVKVLVNFSPQDFAAATLEPTDTDALVSILRNVAREPRVGKVSVIAFNMQEQRVIYRQDGASQIDFPALGAAVKSLALGTVSLLHLVQKNSDTEFLAKLIGDELKEGPNRPDAVIIAGPKVVLDDGVPRDALRQIEVSSPVFYMNYALDPQAFPWRDTIANAVRTLKGSEFTISRPRDVYFAWTEILSRIVKLKADRTSASGASAQ